jgi:hypothetical protein
VQGLKVGISLLLFSTLAAAPLAQLPKAEPYDFLRSRLAFSSSDLATLEKNQILVKLPKTPETREVAAFAIMRLDVSRDFFIERVRDIVNFKKSESVLQIGKFSSPPRLEDLADLTLDQSDIDDIKRCRVKSCDIKMSSIFINRFHKEVDWSALNHRDRVTELVREMLLDRVQAYLKGGNATLGKYEDKSHALALSDEVRTLLKPEPYMYSYVPEFQRYLEGFPLARPDQGARFEDFVYWSKEDFGMKPVISLTHVTIYRSSHDDASDAIIASKGIYASHYFEASLGLTAFIRSIPSEPPRSYLIYVNRSRTDALRGLLAGFKRSLIGGRLREGAKKNMEMIRLKLETDYQKRDQSPPKLGGVAR